MPSSHPPPVVAFLPPPGPAIHDFRVHPTGQITYSPSSIHPPSLQLFRDALVVRAAVFVLGQNCAADKDIEGVDEVSWHWVAYAEAEEGYMSDSERPATANVQERPVATIRLVPAQAHADADHEEGVEGPDYGGSTLWDHKEPYVKIGRLATIAAYRGRGYAKGLMNTAFAFAGNHATEMVKDKEMGEWKGLVLIHAQRNVEGWYKGSGFEVDEGLGRWWEEGIEHVGMWKRVSIK